MRTAFNYETQETKTRNRFVFTLSVIVGITFLFSSYYTDTLGKFTQFVSAEPTILLAVEKDSHGGSCSPNENHGRDIVISVRAGSIGCEYGPGGGSVQAYMKFDTKDLPSEITSATLFLRPESRNYKGSFEIIPIKRNWDENSVRWNGPLKNTYWNTGGLGESELDDLYKIEFELSPISEYVTIDLTPIVRYWQVYDNEGFVIKAKSGSLSFFSKETVDPAFIIVKSRK